MHFVILDQNMIRPPLIELASFWHRPFLIRVQMVRFPYIDVLILDDFVLWPIIVKIQIAYKTYNINFLIV
jgi:hypothetical protein